MKTLMNERDAAVNNVGKDGVMLKAVTEEVLKEEASRDADFKRVYESQNEFMKTYKVWDTRAYVPADL